MHVTCVYVSGRVVVTFRGKVPVDYECHQKIGKVDVKVGIIVVMY